MSSFRNAYVYIRNTFSVILQENDDGYEFQYDIDYLNSNGAYKLIH